jgi:signal transduction histidine kinase
MRGPAMELLDTQPSPLRYWLTLLGVSLRSDMAQEFWADVESVGRIESVPTILDVVCRATGMRFAAVARVTENRWIACSVLDQIDFGLKPGGELRVETTICHEVRECREAVIINHVAEDEVWRDHPTPAMYGFQSYISMPIILADGSFFGTLCAIDPRPARLNTPETIGMFRLFAELIAKHLDAERKLAAAETALLDERADSELREQFIAVLAHDLRTPMRSINTLMELLMKTSLEERAVPMARLVRESASRMVTLIDNMLDLARARLGGGLTVIRDADAPLEPVLREVIAELNASNPDRRVETTFTMTAPVSCDRARVAQLFSNLLGNALTYGAKDQPVRVRATSNAGVLELSVANAGEPIPAAALERLFQPFYRSAVLQNREGLGLGLFIAHEIATAHGGTLSVKSTREETRFTFRMPNQPEL